MCALFDVSWKYLIALALLVSLAVFPLRMRIAALAAGQASRSGEAKRPAGLQALVLLARGVVAIVILTLFVLGFVCAGSPGDIVGVIPE